MKFVIPNSQMKSRIIDLWNATFKKRHQFRVDNQFIEYAVDFPVMTAYNGELVNIILSDSYLYSSMDFLTQVTIDFKIIHQEAAPFLEKWDDLEPKILTRYDNLFKNMKNGTYVYGKRNLPKINFVQRKSVLWANNLLLGKVKIVTLGSLLYSFTKEM